jgi:hypothetical protein
MRVAAAMVMLGLVMASPSRAQDGRFHVIAGKIQQRTNGVLALMGYSQTPDVTSGALSIKNGSTGNPAFNNTSLGGGFTVSESAPVYLEGTLGYARYDPKFLITDGAESRTLPTRWNSLIGTVGVGWDFRLAEHWVLRPIANGSIGWVSSDVALGSRVVTNRTDLDVDFLDRGTLRANGVGGSLMLDYERYEVAHEIDMELRYTNIYLKSYGGTTPSVKGNSRNENIGLWARWRAPTGWHALDRPVRYVLEFAHTTYLGEDAKVVGIDNLTSLGVGLELDSSKNRPLFISRTRLVARYVFGPHVTGVSLGLAVTF